jgi:hypothetical protein
LTIFPNQLEFVKISSNVSPLWVRTSLPHQDREELRKGAIRRPRKGFFSVEGMRRERFRPEKNQELGVDP